MNHVTPKSTVNIDIIAVEAASGFAALLLSKLEISDGPIVDDLTDLTWTYGERQMPPIPLKDAVEWLRFLRDDPICALIMGRRT